MTTPTLHPMKKIEIVIKGDTLAAIEDLLKQGGVTGYTIIRDVSGLGHGGYHGGRLLFNDRDSFLMIVTVAPEEKIQQILIGLKPFFEHHSGVLFVSDTQVLRMSYFKGQEG